MADIASTDVTYTLIDQRIQDSGLRHRQIKIEFGDGALTYPAGGVPLLNGSLGVPNNNVSTILYDTEDGDGFVYKYDRDNNKVRIYQGDNNNAADAPLIELVSGVATPTAADLFAEVKGW